MTDHLFSVGNKAASRWRPEHDAALKGLFDQGYSFSQIAKSLNEEFATRYTRNATLGRAHRTGIGSSVLRKTIPRKPTVVKEPDRTHPRYNGGSERKRAARPVLPRETAILRCSEIVPQHMDLLARATDGCCWPYGDGPFTFCNNPQLGGFPYCAPHHELSRGAGTLSERSAGRHV